MFRFFDLPREIRDHVINFAVLSPLPLPANAKRMRWQRLLYNNRVFFVMQTSYHPNALNFLLVNRQMYFETMECVSRTNRDFSLDLAIVDSCWFWPTWRFIPLNNGPHLERFEINIVPCCKQEERHLQTNWQRQSYPHVHIEHMLWQFTRHATIGPVLSRDVEKDAGIQIDRLILSIDTSRYQTGEEILSLEEVPVRDIDGMAHLTNHPLYPIDAQSSEDLILDIAQQVKGINSLHIRSSDAPFAGIKAIEFRVDGQLRDEIRLESHVEP